MHLRVLKLKSRSIQFQAYFVPFSRLTVQPLSKLHRKDALHRNADRNSDVRIPAVVHVIAVIGVDNIDIVVVVPVISPVFRPGVNRTDPIALVLKAGISTHNQERKAGDAELVILTKVSTITVVRNAIAVVAPPLLPCTVVGVPAL